MAVSSYEQYTPPEPQTPAPFPARWDPRTSYETGSLWVSRREGTRYIVLGTSVTTLAWGKTKIEVTWLDVDRWKKMISQPELHSKEPVTMIRIA